MDESDKPKKDPENRLTITDSIYYQCPGMDVVEISEPFTRFLQTAEQAYSRATKVGAEFTKVDTGWVEKASCLYLRNTHSIQSMKVPSIEEKEELQLHILEILLEDNSTKPLLLSPGESLRIRPSDLSSIKIRSQYSDTKYLVYALPE